MSITPIAYLFYGIKVTENDLFGESTSTLDKCPECLLESPSKFCPYCGRDLSTTVETEKTLIKRHMLEDETIGNLDLLQTEDETYYIGTLISRIISLDFSVKSVSVTGMRIAKDDANKELDNFFPNREFHRAYYLILEMA